MKSRLGRKVAASTAQCLALPSRWTSLQTPVLSTLPSLLHGPPLPGSGTSPPGWPPRPTAAVVCFLFRLVLLFRPLRGGILKAPAWALSWLLIIGQITGPPPQQLRHEPASSASVSLGPGAGGLRLSRVWVSVPQAAVKTLAGAAQSSVRSATTVGSASSLAHVLTGGTRGSTGCWTGLSPPGPLARCLLQVLATWVYP